MQNSSSIQFTPIGRLGSLYFKESEIVGCKPAVVTTSTKDVVDHIESRYCVGPITRSEFWEKQRGEVQYHGSCKCFDAHQIET